MSTPTPDLVNERIVSVPSAAKHFDVSVPTMWRWVLSRRVPSVKLGMSRKVTIESVAAALMREQETP